MNKSNCVSWVNYTKGNKLDVEYVGGQRYRYYGVPLTAFMSISNAESRGESIHKHLKLKGVKFIKHDRRFKLYG